MYTIQQYQAAQLDFYTFHRDNAHYKHRVPYSLNSHYNITVSVDFTQLSEEEVSRHLSDVLIDNRIAVCHPYSCTVDFAEDRLPDMWKNYLCEPANKINISQFLEKNLILVLK